MVASRRLDGGETSFAVTGQLWMPERAFERASEDAGRTFRERHPDGEVLLPPPHSGTVEPGEIL